MYKRTAKQAVLNLKMDYCEYLGIDPDTITEDIPYACVWIYDKLKFGNILYYLKNTSTYYSPQDVYKMHFHLKKYNNPIHTFHKICTSENSPIKSNHLTTLFNTFK
jgi:hypothetical protein